jgi:hypothetical protein
MEESLSRPERYQSVKLSLIQALAIATMCLISNESAPHRGRSLEQPDAFDFPRAGEENLSLEVRCASNFRRVLFWIDAPDFQCLAYKPERFFVESLPEAVSHSVQFQ